MLYVFFNYEYYIALKVYYYKNYSKLLVYNKIRKKFTYKNKLCNFLFFWETHTKYIYNAFTLFY